MISVASIFGFVCPASAQPCSPACARYVTAALELQWFAAVAHNDPIAVCIREHESGGDYTIVGFRNWRDRGAYQFEQPTWDAVARRQGWPWLIGLDPIRATVRDQDFMFEAARGQDGLAPWRGDPCVG